MDRVRDTWVYAIGVTRIEFSLYLIMLKKYMYDTYGPFKEWAMAQNEFDKTQPAQHKVNPTLNQSY